MNLENKDIDVIENIAKLDFLNNGVKIYQYPELVLRKKCIQITDFNDEVKKICMDLASFCWNIRAMGLSSPQIGTNKRVLVVNKQIAINVKRPSIFINPVITNQTGESVYKEGCVSLPAIFGNVKRFNTFDIEYQDIDGNKLVEHIDDTRKDVFGTIIQHEVDHLDGILFIDKLSDYDKDKVIKKINKLRKL